MELLVVLVILIATAAFVIPRFNVTVATADGTAVTPQEIATQTSLQAIRQAIVGDQGILENLAHEPGALPREISELVEEKAPEHVQKTKQELTKYDPVFRIGWRGPYLFATGTNEIGKPTLVDGWGNEFKLQVDFDKNGQVNQTESQFMRVVSAGPNGEIETPEDVYNMKPGKDGQSELTRSECGDDMVIFLRVPDVRN